MSSSTITKESGSVSSNEGLPIYYDCYLPPNSGAEPLPVVIFLHGFKGFKDWGAFPEACAAISEAGFAVAAMNFSLNGVGESMTEFDQLDLFARETLSQDLEDVRSMISAIHNEQVFPAGSSVDTGSIGLLGHSRGGHTAVAAAAEYAEVASVVTWSAVADYNARWSEDMISDWENKGVTEIMNGRTGQVMPVKDVVYKDALENADRLMAVKRARELTIPALFIHSKGDEAASYDNAEQLYRNCASDHKDLKLIEDSGHTFDTAHPFDEDEFPEAFQQALDYTTAWFQKHLQ
ncbi:alpha/beta hydrolase family protein [Fodinibius halophilus]|uniref:Prolyl oligopeptidase family serine peptidase n=1 Tax=Fodinibius halophilus TaxID=1736908 RepID=A0A6M1T618_9BACT|nr:alpha/beta fold hydrolase [Fodinibius halophilus]NGP89557.1 prolyl oligopeptidase family serine peptidase [Fodinibius halophilus]